MLKKVISVGVVLACILMLVPASSIQAQGGTDWKSELGDWSGKTLKVIMIQDPWVGAFDELDKEFEDLTGAKIVIDSYGYDQTQEKEVLVGTSQSTDYDVVVFDSPWIGQFAESGFVEDLTPYIAKTNPDIVAWDDFVTPFQVVPEWKGQIIGIPFGAYFVMLHYRTDLFEQAGLQPPSTFADWEADAAALTKGMTYGTALNNQRGSAIGQAWFEYIYAMGGKPFASEYPGSPDPYADMTPQFASPEGIAVAQLFVDMLKYEPPGAENFAWDERATSFMVGQVAMVNAWSVRTPGFANPDQSGIVGKWATTLFPHQDGVDPVSPLGGWVMGINKFSEQKDMAWDYIKWFTSPEIHKKFVLAGGPPSRLSTMQDPDVLAAQPWVSTLYEAQQTAFADCRPRIPESFQIISTLGDYLSQAITGQMTAEEAMKAADADIGKLLKDAGYVVNQ